MGLGIDLGDFPQKWFLSLPQKAFSLGNMAYFKPGIDPPTPPFKTIARLVPCGIPSLATPARLEALNHHISWTHCNINGGYLAPLLNKMGQLGDHLIMLASFGTT